MKYDSDGIPYEMEQTEHIPKFLSRDEAEYFFTRLRKRIPWKKIKLPSGKYLQRLVHRYDEEIEEVEELRFIVEEVLETSVHKIQCSLYRNGEDCCPYHSDGNELNVLSISLGETRRFLLRNNSNGEVHISHLSSGDGFYFSSEIDRTHEHGVPKSSRNTGERISIVFFVEKPYSRRNTLRSISNLGERSRSLEKSERISEIHEEPSMPPRDVEDPSSESIPNEHLTRETIPLIPIDPKQEIGIVALDPQDVVTEVKSIPVYVGGQRVLSIPFSGDLGPGDPKELYLTPEEFAMLPEFIEYLGSEAIPDLQKSSVDGKIEEID
jgi:hypothetical protein